MPVRPPLCNFRAPVSAGVLCNFATDGMDPYVVQRLLASLFDHVDDAIDDTGGDIKERLNRMLENIAGPTSADDLTHSVLYLYCSEITDAQLGAVGNDYEDVDRVTLSAPRMRIQRLFKQALSGGCP